MKSKTKAELIKEIEDCETEIASLRDVVDYWEDECNRLQDELDKYSTADLKSESSIIDISDFKFRLSLDGLLTPQLEQFIYEYLKFHQEC